MNDQIFFALHSLARQSCPTDRIIIFFANYLLYILIILTIIYAFKADFGKFNFKNPFSVFKKRVGFLLDTLGLATISWLVAHILKGIVRAPRPFIFFNETVVPLFAHGGLDSFPSGHASFFSAMALALFLVNKKLGYITAASAILVGLARIIAGVHFPVDIIFGYLVGLLVVLLCHLLTNIKKKQRAPSSK